MDQFLFSKKNIIQRYNNRLGGKIMLYNMDEWQSFQLDSLKQKNYGNIV